MGLLDRQSSPDGTTSNSTIAANTGRKDPDNIWTAASDGNLERVREWLPSMGVNAQDENGYAPLHAAAAWNHLPLAEFLLNEGADIGIRDCEGDTPLHHCDTVEMAQFLVDRGAPVDAKNDEGEMPIHAAWEEGNEELVAFYRARLPADCVPEEEHEENLGDHPDVQVQITEEILREWQKQFPASFQPEQQQDQEERQQKENES